MILLQYYRVGLLALGLGLQACQPSVEPAQKGLELELPLSQGIQLSAAQKAQAKLEIGQAEERQMAYWLKLRAETQLPPQGRISLGAMLGGYLKSTNLMPGMWVKKGQTLAVLEDPQFVELQTNYLSCLAKLEQLDAEYERQKALSAQQASSQKQFEQVRADRQTERLRQQNLAEKLRLIGLVPETLTADKISARIVLPSPMEAQVAALPAQIGQYLQPGDPIIELVDPTKLQIKLEVFEKDLALVKIGQGFRVRSAAEPERSYSGKIRFIEPGLSANRTLILIGTLDQAAPELVPGLYLEAELAIENQRTWALPEGAFVLLEGQNYIFSLAADSSYLMHKVEKLTAEQGYVQFSLPSPPDSLRFVRQGAYHLLMAAQNKAED